MFFPAPVFPTPPRLAAAAAGGIARNDVPDAVQSGDHGLGHGVPSLAIDHEQFAVVVHRPLSPAEFLATCTYRSCGGKRDMFSSVHWHQFSVRLANSIHIEHWNIGPKNTHFFPEFQYEVEDVMYP